MLFRVSLVVLFSLVFFSCESSDSEVSKKWMEMQFEEFIAKIEKEDSAQQIVEAYMDTLGQVPIVEDTVAYFLYYGNGTSIQVSGDFSGWRPSGNCGLHSGAFQANNFETNKTVMDGVKKDIKVVSIWGSYEGGSLLNNMHQLKDYLLEKDYELYWKELPEGHSWGLWRATQDDILTYFFPFEN
ncbi:MAG: hypothetical protein ABJH98_03345 [Reichenbachiella sp.]|uniref:hypothetical protein n=1 Tax=Reichenbachiella sp. TaxID=2184521 RepID=UPI0032984CF7